MPSFSKVIEGQLRFNDKRNWQQLPVRIWKLRCLQDGSRYEKETTKLAPNGTSGSNNNHNSNNYID